MTTPVSDTGLGGGGIQAAATTGRLRSRGRSSDWLGKPPARTGLPLLVFTCCDAVYLDYALALARSLDVFSPGASLALHLVNPEADSVARVQQLRSGLAHTQLHLSTELIHLDDLPLTSRRAYYASARFLRLSEWFGQIGAPVLCLDADSLIVAPIDLNFSDKARAELCLVRRDVGGDAQRQHLSVANGSIWLKPTPVVRQWLDAVADELAAAFEGDGQGAGWFIDQRVVARQVDAFQGRASVFNIKPKYADWTFRADSLVWAGKGDRKREDLRFSVLQRLLGDQPDQQATALRLGREAFPEPDLPMRQRIERAAQHTTTRVALFLPRLDLPWGSAIRPGRVPPALALDTLELRLPWAQFAAQLANAIERKGVQVDVIELPAPQITPDRVSVSACDLAVVPHRCHLDFGDPGVPVRFYMQEYFRWVFVVDERGWSAASSRYPLQVPADPLSEPETAGVADDYRQRLNRGQLQSKFAQPEPVDRDTLCAQGELPPGPYLFFPLQVPHDQSIRYFSDFDELQVVQALAAWCRDRGHTLVLKPHPVNPKAMAPFEALAAEWGAWWSHANVNDLIRHARAVFTINSGVGFEALLHGLPVVTFGRAEYDAVTHHARPDTLDAVWQAVSADADAAARWSRYAAFLNHFLGRVAVDLSLPEHAERRLDEIAHEIAVAARAHRARQQQRMTAVPQDPAALQA